MLKVLTHKLSPESQALVDVLEVATAWGGTKESVGQRFDDEISNVEKLMTVAPTDEDVNRLIDYRKRLQDAKNVLRDFFE